MRGSVWILLAGKGLAGWVRKCCILGKVSILCVERMWKYMKVIELAKYVCNEMDKAGSRVDNLKLLKLLYFIQGVHLAAYDEPAFPETIYAWDYGPVVPEVYHHFKIHAADPIPEYAFRHREELEQRLQKVVSKTLDVYGKMSGGRLVAQTHLPGTPWMKSYKAGVGWIEIPNESIKEYFKNNIVKKSDGKQ